MNDINAGLRQRLALDAPDSGPEVIEHHGGPDPLPAPRRNGKKAPA